MILHPLRLEAKENNHYLITFSSEKGELQFPFQIEEVQLEEQSFPIASWDVSFSIATIGEARDYADELLQAIHCFNRARKLDPAISMVSFEKQDHRSCRYRITVGIAENEFNLFVDVANGVAQGSLSALTTSATEPLLKAIERFDHSINLSKRDP